MSLNFDNTPIPAGTGALLDAVAASTAAEVKAAETASAAESVTLTRAELLDLLTTAAQIGHDMDYAGLTRGDITAVVEGRMRRSLADLRTTPVDLVPTEISGYRVTDAVRASSLDSLIVHVIAEDERGERVVWDCIREDGKWVAENGAYGRSRSWCLGVLVKRLGWEL